MHSLAVCALMVALAKRMGLDDHSLRKAGMAGLMHDLGKTAIPVAVLNKPGPLDHRSEEHTSELQSPCNLVCRLLLEKKNALFRHELSVVAGRALDGSAARPRPLITPLSISNGRTSPP